MITHAQRTRGTVFTKTHEIYIISTKRHITTIPICTSLHATSIMQMCIRNEELKNCVNARVRVRNVYGNISNIQKNCAHKWIYFEISLISKIYYLRCFVPALLKLLSYLSFSFMEIKQVCLFTFPSCSCCNVVLNWIYWSSWTILVLCDLQVVFNFSLRNIQIIYFLTPSPLIFATRALRVDFSFINMLIYYFCIDKIL